MSANMKRMRAIAGSMLLLASGAVAATTADPYTKAIEKYRTERVTKLTAEDGWLTLAGLYWLRYGENKMGSDTANPVVLMAPGIPPVAGSLFLDGESVRVVAAPGAKILLGNEVVTERVLHDDAAGTPDVLTAGRLKFHAIKRGNRYGVRVKDPECPSRKKFLGLEYFPVDPAWHVRGTFEALPQPREVRMGTMAGTVENLLVPGSVTFEVAGKKYTLSPFLESESDKQMWFIFADATSGKETYGFRYLYADIPTDKTAPIDLDFNKAYNPPCAFTAYATCPIAPRENRLDLPIEAGEKIYGKHDAPTAAAPKGKGSPIALDAEALVRKYTEAFNQHDVEAMLALTDPNIEWLNVKGSGVAPETVGRDALRTAMLSYFRQSPSTRSVIEDVMAAGNHVTVRERAEWVTAGKTQAQRALAVYDVHDGKIRRVWYYPAYK